MLKNLTTPSIFQHEIIKPISTSSTSQYEILKNMRTSSISKFEMLQGSVSPDIVTEHAFIEHAIYEEPQCLLKSFTKQLSITCQLKLDEVSVDGVDEDNHAENSTQKYACGYSGTISVNELQQTSTAELLQRGPFEQNFVPDHSSPVTAYIHDPTADQTSQTSGLNCSSSIPCRGTSGSANLVPGFPHSSLGTRIPLELLRVPNSHNQFFLQMISPATGFNPSSIPADTPNFYNRSGRLPGHIKSSLESSSAAPTASSPSSSSSLISSTDGEMMITKRILATKDGQMHHQNEPRQTTHDDARKRSQINVHAGIKTDSHLSRQHLMQSQQQNLHMTNSHEQQYNYFYEKPFVNQHEVVDSSLSTQMYESPCAQLSDFSKLPNAHDTEQTTSRTQTPSISHEIECPQKYYPLQVSPHCNRSDNCKCLKENSYDIPGGSQLHQTNQQTYNNHSIPCGKRSQINACPSTYKSLNPAGPSQSRHVQSSDVENQCHVKNPHIMHGEYQHPFDYEIISKQSLHSRHRKSESHQQLPGKGKHHFLGHSTAETTTQGKAPEKTHMDHWRAKLCNPQSNMINNGMDKCSEWLNACKNRIIGANMVPFDYNKHAENTRSYDHNNHKAYDRQHTKQTTEYGEITTGHAHVHTEHSNLPRGLFDGKPIPDSQQPKSNLIKKHSPRNKETVPPKGNLKQSFPKEVQKSKAESVDRNCSYTPSIHFQHYNDTDSCIGCTPEIPSNGLCTDNTIDKIRQKQLLKYKCSVSSYYQLTETNIQKAGAATDEDIKLPDEKSLQEMMLRSSTSSDSETVSGKNKPCILPDGTHSTTATSSRNRNKGRMHKTGDKDKDSYRQLNCDPVCTTRADQASWLKHVSQKENGVLVRTEEHQVQTSNKDMQNLPENTDPRCLKQISNKNCDDNIEKFGMNNSFNCESPEANVLYPDINHDQQNTEHDRTPDYKQVANNPNNCGYLSYYASNYQNIGSIKPQQKITENQSPLGTLQNHTSPSHYANSMSVEHVRGRQVVDVTQKHPSLISGSRNACFNQTKTHRFDSAGCPTPGLPNKCRGRNAASSPNTSNVFLEYTQNTYSNKFMPHCMPHNFHRHQRPSLYYSTQAYGSQVPSSLQSKSYQPSCIVPSSVNQSGVISTTKDGCSVPSSSLVTFVMARLPCPSVSSPSSSQSFQETHFKIPYSVDQNRNGSNLHYNESVQTAPCYSSIDTGSDVSMRSDNSLSRSRASEKTHSYQQDPGYKEALPTSYQLQHQGLQLSHQQLQQQNYSPHDHFENQTYTDTRQQQHIQSCSHQNDQQITSQDRNDFQSCSSKGRMHLPCFLQSADSDDHIISRHSSAPQSITSHLLNPVPCYQTAPSTQSENLESIMTSISEKSLMSTGTSDDCYVDKTNSSEQQTHDTAKAGIQEGSNSPLNIIHNHTTPNNSKTGLSLQQASCSSGIVTNRDTNIHSSTAASQHVEAAPDVFPTLNFEDCRDAMPLSLSSSTDMEPILTLTKPDQVLVKDGGLDDPAGRSEPTLRSCQHKSVEPVPCTGAGIGASNSACEGDSHVLVRPDRDPVVEETDILSGISFLSELDDDLNVENKNQRIKDLLQDLNQ